MAACPMCYGKEYDLAHGTVRCIVCGSIAPAGALVEQITYLNGRRIDIAA